MSPMSRKPADPYRGLRYHLTTLHADIDEARGAAKRSEELGERMPEESMTADLVGEDAVACSSAGASSRARDGSPS